LRAAHPATKKTPMIPAASHFLHFRNCSIYRKPPSFSVG
jgi:hypothetical protein